MYTKKETMPKIKHFFLNINQYSQKVYSPFFIFLYFQLGMALVLPTVILSGILWPREGMSSLLNSFAEIMPVTLSCDLAQSLMINLSGPTSKSLSWGVSLPIIWSLGFMIFCKMRMNTWTEKN